MMRFKLISLFVAIQLFSFGIWAAMPGAAAIVEADTPEPSAQVHPAPDAISEQEEPVVKASVHFDTRNMDERQRFLNSIRESQIQTALQKLPAAHVATIRNIILDYNEEAHRGLGGSSMVILRAVNMGTDEMLSVLVHELAHNVDFGYLEPTRNTRESSFKDGQLPLYESDPSLDFYRISWLKNDQRRKAANNMDFVSGYAMSDPFEDFAETYTYYVLHNKDFKALAASSDALLAKYRFMKYRVFGGNEFDTGDGEVRLFTRPWDVTILGYDLSYFMS